MNIKHALLLSLLLLATLLLPAPHATAADETAEAKAIAVLQSDAAWEDKQQACRELRQVGTVTALPELAALLTDPKLSCYARFALEPMPWPEVDAVLHDALAKAAATQKTGIVIAIGVRRDASAVPPLVPLLADADNDLARAAAGALGRIATPEAVDTLKQFLPKAPDATKFAVQEALLAAAQRWIANKKGDDAAALCEIFTVPGTSDNLRMGAFYLLASAQPDKTPDRLLAALAGDDARLRDMAARIISETKGADLTNRYAAALSGLFPDGQVALVRALAGRGDTAARLAVVKMVESSDKNVKVAAIKALAALGTAGDVPGLVALMTGEDTDSAATARATLATIEGAPVDAAIADSCSSAPVPVKAQLVALLLERRADQALPMAVDQARSGDVPVRDAALHTLAVLGTKDNAPLLISLLDTAPDNAARSAVEDALGSLCARCGDDALPVVINAMGCSRPESRVALLHAVGRAGGPAALDCVVKGLNDADETFRNEALRELSDWPTADAAPHLLELAKSDQENRRVLGLRGYIRLARATADPGAKAAMLNTAMELAKQPEEKWQVLAAWGTLKTVTSLDALLPFLKDEKVKNEAGSAIVSVATELVKADGDTKTRAADALKAVTEACDNTTVVDSAKRVLDGLG